MQSECCYGFVKDDSVLKKNNHLYSMLVIRIKFGQVSLSHPCSLCAIALEKSPIKKIIFTLNNQEYQIISNKGISRHHISSSQREHLFLDAASDRSSSID